MRSPIGMTGHVGRQRGRRGFPFAARFLRCRARHLLGVQIVAFILMAGFSVRRLIATITLERLRREVEMHSYGFVDGAPSPGCRRPLPTGQLVAQALDAFRIHAPASVMNSSIDFQEWESYVTGPESSKWRLFTASFWRFQPGLTVVDIGDGTPNSPHLVTYIRIWKSANDFIRFNLVPAAGPGAMDVTGRLAPLISGRRGGQMTRRKVGSHRLSSKVFTFVRSPISHFVSGYNEVEYRWTHDFGNYSTVFIPEYCQSKGCVFHKFPMGSTERVWAFLGDLLLGKLALLREVGHVYAQLGALPKGLRIDFVGRLENFNEDWRHVLDTFIHADSDQHEYEFDPSVGAHNSTNFEAGEAAKRLVANDPGFVRVLEELLVLEFMCWGYPPHAVDSGGVAADGRGDAGSR